MARPGACPHGFYRRAKCPECGVPPGEKKKTTPPAGSDDRRLEDWRPLREYLRIRSSPFRDWRQ